MNIAKFLRTASFIEHRRKLLFKVMFDTCQNFIMKNKKDVYKVSIASLLITWILLTSRWTASTVDNDQVKAVGKDYANAKPVRPVCVCVATMLQ